MIFVHVVRRVVSMVAPWKQTKKKRLTSWQRRKEKDGAIAKPKPGKTIAALQLAVAEAKASSEEARNRYRLRQPAQEGDAELAAHYSSAKAALNEYMKSLPQKPARVVAPKPASAPEAEPTEVPKPAAAPNAAPVADQARPKQKKSVAKPPPGGADCPANFSAEALGVSREARRLAKKEAKRDARKEEKRRT